MSSLVPALVVLTGSIGSGKSTVGRLAVAETDLDFIAEDVDSLEEDRRVLDSYYAAVAEFSRAAAESGAQRGGRADRSRSAPRPPERIRAVVFDTQAHFIRRRSATLRERLAAGRSGLAERHPNDDIEIFSRRSLEQGLLRAADVEELRRLAARELDGVPDPSLAVFLHADPIRLRERIARRGRPQERDLIRADNPYLDELDRLYADWFERCPFPKTRIRTDDLDETTIASRVREAIRAHRIR
jgi:deoxyadenosine/deoxycytidine kinase